MRFYYSPQEARTMTGPFRCLSMNSLNIDRPLPQVFVDGTWLAYTSYQSGPSNWKDAIVVYEGQRGRTNPDDPQNGDTRVEFIKLKDPDRYTSHKRILPGTLNVWASLRSPSVKETLERNPEARMLFTISDGDDTDRAMAMAAMGLTPDEGLPPALDAALSYDSLKAKLDRDGVPEEEARIMLGAIPHIRKLARAALWKQSTDQ